MRAVGYRKACRSPTRNPWSTSRSRCPTRPARPARRGARRLGQPGRRQGPGRRRPAAALQGPRLRRRRRGRRRRPAVTAFAVGDEVYYAAPSPGPAATPNSSSSTSASPGTSRHPRLRRGRRAAADHDHRVGDAVRPASALTATAPARCSSSAPPAGRLDGDPARPRQLTNLTVIAHRVRPDPRVATRMGAHHVVDHHDLRDAVRAVAPDGVDYVFSPYSRGNIDDLRRDHAPVRRTSSRSTSPKGWTCSRSRPRAWPGTGS